MNQREVRRQVREHLADHIRMLEREALVEWVGHEHVETAESEVYRIAARLDPRDHKAVTR